MEKERISTSWIITGTRHLMEKNGHLQHGLCTDSTNFFYRFWIFRCWSFALFAEQKTCLICLIQRFFLSFCFFLHCISWPPIKSQASFICRAQNLGSFYRTRQDTVALLFLSHSSRWNKFLKILPMGSSQLVWTKIVHSLTPEKATGRRTTKLCFRSLYRYVDSNEAAPLCSNSSKLEEDGDELMLLLREDCRWTEEWLDSDGSDCIITACSLLAANWMIVVQVG